MASMSSPLGADNTVEHATAQFKVGTRGFDINGNEFVYTQADGGGVTGEGYVVLLDPTDWLDSDMLDLTNAASKEDLPVGVSPIAVTADYYYWCQISGPCNIRVKVSAAANAVLNNTATVGVLDDDGSVGAEVIKHLVLTTANTTTAEAAVAGYIQYPSVGATG